MGDLLSSDFMIPIVVAVAVIALMMIGLIYSSYYVKVPPDEAAVFTGRGKKTIITGGSRFRLPLFERVDRMDLAPFEIPITLDDAYSGEGVKVKIRAVGVVKFGSDQEALSTSTQRFLNTPREQLKAMLTDALNGHVRGVVGTLTVEDLNQNRTAFSAKVQEEAATDLQTIGMQIDMLPIKEISDDVNYLDALGRKRTAEVIRDAEIGEAEAKSEAEIKSAAAKQAGAEASAKADAAIAIAEQARDTQKADSRAAVQTAQATADQAGPLAEAQAKKGVVEAEVAVKEQNERASIAVEEQRILRETKAQEATVVVPAKAKKDAQIAESEGEKQAAINRAEGQKAKVQAEGEGDAEARKAQAEAHQRELEAEAAGTKAKLLAEAEGIEAKLLAEAKGKDELAKALNAYSESALQLELIPGLIEQFPEMFSAIASAYTNVDSLIMVDTGGGENGPMSKVANQAFGMLVGGLNVARSMGLKIPGVEFTEQSDGGEEAEGKDRSARAIPEAKPAPMPDGDETGGKPSSARTILEKPAAPADEPDDTY